MDETTPSEHPASSRTKYLWWLAGVVLVCGVLFLGPTVYAKFSTQSRRFQLSDMDKIPRRQVALVLGAGVYKDGTLTPYLRWRVDTAIQLYEHGKVSKLLMSGDNSTKHYNEPVAMQKYAMAHGVPKSNIVLDYAGFSTYDSCYRAQAIFGIKSMLVVTQGYHLPRAVMTCNDFGMPTDGVAALRQKRDFTAAYLVREYISTTKATFQLVFKPKPTVLGKYEPIL